MLRAMSVSEVREAEYPTVLFICTGNTCRSPLAEGLMRAAVEEEGIKARSAGVSAWPGAAMSPESSELLRERGASLAGFRSRAVSIDLIREATVVVCMTTGHLRILKEEYPEEVEKFYLAGDFAGEPGTDVPDPIGMGPGAYGEVAETFDKMIEGLKKYLASLKKS